MTDDAIPTSAPRRPGLLGASAQFGLFAIVALLWLVFSTLAPGFTSPINLFSIGRSLAIDIVIGFSQMVVLATGGMNLAVGSIGVCAVMASGFLLQDLGLPIPLALAGALALGAALGWLNGVAIVRTGVNAFIITLASASLFLGAMLILTKAVPYNGLPPEIGAFGRMRIGGYVSPLLIIALAIGAALYVLYRHSALGRQILAAGANPRAAAMSGVPVDRVIVISHTLSGLLAATAGLMIVARLGAAMPSVGGEEWLLPSFLGPVLGGTLLAGGSVAVVGTIIGAALVTTIRSGLLVLQIGNFWLQLFLGLILLAAVMADRYRGIFVERRSMGRR
ncbi:ABC transporter permease [Kumtagia ephedrae]|uniref:ABC transporter permease n=1 Tax=Kumtagia ephedrae TaxID=2116701 RepID=A0A2P7SJI7_9HYPH|nr:ABC transporter permease [Mesorhizobium ephedrae]PSJ62656.1 ABC transporter permease [Mesorhizobium ephedrae]